MNPATIPCPAEDLHGDNRWMSLHKRYLDESKEKEPDVVFIGDSIIQQLAQHEAWTQMFAPMHSLNLGIGGDKTENVLWRINEGELDHIKPKVIVVLVGTNNIGSTAKQISEGIFCIVESIREKHLEAYIVVLGLLPRGQSPNPLRERNNEVNKLLKSKVRDMVKVEFLCIDNGLVQLNGTISHHDMYDYLHLTGHAYKKVFEPVQDLLNQLLTEGEPETDLTPSD